MPQLKVGIQLASLRLPFKKALLTAAELGADAVEIDARGEFKPRDVTQTAMRQIRKMLDDCNLRVCAVGFRTRRGYDVLDDLDRRVDATKEALRFAHLLGAPVVINQVGRVPTDPDEPAWGRLLEVLSDLGLFGQHVGTVLAAETGSEEGADLARLLARLPAGGVGVNFDPGNLIINGFSASQALAAVGPDILHVHAKDAVRDLAQGRGLETPLGRGSADLPEIVGGLEEYAYRGFFTVEREHAADPIREVGLAVEYLRSL